MDRSKQTHNVVSLIDTFMSVAKDNGVDVPVSVEGMDGVRF